MNLKIKYKQDIKQVKALENVLDVVKERLRRTNVMKF
jgi:hypothetical protein